MDKKRQDGYFHKIMTDYSECIEKLIVLLEQAYWFQDQHTNINNITIYQQQSFRTYNRKNKQLTTAMKSIMEQELI